MTKISRTALAFNLALMASVAAMPAKAADLGQCFSSQQAFRAAMKNEGQHALITAISIDGSEGTSLITGNEDGSVGYYLKANVAPDSPLLYTPSHELCVDTTLTNVDLHNGNVPGVPLEALVASEDTDAVHEQCAGDAHCGLNNETLKKQDANSDLHVLLTAQVVGSVETGLGRARGSLMTVSARLSDTPVVVSGANYLHPGIIALTTKEGAYKGISSLTSAGYGSYAITKLNAH